MSNTQKIQSKFGRICNKWRKKTRKHAIITLTNTHEIHPSWCPIDHSNRKQFAVLLSHSFKSFEIQPLKFRFFPIFFLFLLDEMTSKYCSMCVSWFLFELFEKRNRTKKWNRTHRMNYNDRMERINQFLESLLVCTFLFVAHSIYVKRMCVCVRSYECIVLAHSTALVCAISLWWAINR